MLKTLGTQRTLEWTKKWKGEMNFWNLHHLRSRMSSLKITWMKKNRQMLDSFPSILFNNRIIHGLQGLEAILMLVVNNKKLSISLPQKQSQKQIAKELFLTTVKKMSKTESLFQICLQKRLMINKKTDLQLY